MSHFILLNDGRKVEVQTVKEESGNLKIRMLLQTSEQLKAYFLDEFATKKLLNRMTEKKASMRIINCLILRRKLAAYGKWDFYNQMQRRLKN